jgi:hypothetical protein
MADYTVVIEDSIPVNAFVTREQLVEWFEGHYMLMDEESDGESTYYCPAKDKWLYRKSSINAWTVSPIIAGAVGYKRIRGENPSGLTTDGYGYQDETGPGIDVENVASITEYVQSVSEPNSNQETITFGIITDNHFRTTEDDIAGISRIAPFWVVRRYDKAIWRFDLATSLFNLARQDLDFWVSNGDEIDWSLTYGEGYGSNQNAENVIEMFADKASSVQGVPFYNSRGHHTSRSIDPYYSQYVGNDFSGLGLTEDDFYKYVEPVMGPRDNQFPLESDIKNNYDPSNAGDPSDFVPMYPRSYYFEKNGIRIIFYERHFGGDDVINSHIKADDYDFVGDHYLWLDNALDTPLPKIIFSHCSLYGPPSDGFSHDGVRPTFGSGFISNDRVSLHERFVNAGNVQAVICGHWHPGSRTEVYDGISYISLWGSIATDAATVAEWVAMGENANMYIVEGAESQYAHYIITVNSNTGDPDSNPSDIGDYYSTPTVSRANIVIKGFGYNGRRYSNNGYYNVVADEPVNIDDNPMVEAYLADGETVPVTFLNNEYLVGNVGEQMVWDKGGDVEYTFSGGDGETLKRYLGGSKYQVTYIGSGSFIFSVSSLATDLYKIIADRLDIIILKRDDVLVNIREMWDHCTNSNITNRDIHKSWMTNSIDSAYTTFSNKNVLQDQRLSDFIVALSRYVIGLQGGTLNEYLEENGIMVYADFAHASNLAGYPIDSSHIIASSTTEVS